MVSVEMYMVTVEYDKTAELSKHQELPVSKITPIYVVPYDNMTGRWESSNYMRNEESTAFGILGIRVQADHSETVSVQLSTNVALAYDSQSDIWYERSRFKLVEEKYQYRTSIESIGTAGELVVTIHADKEVLEEHVLFYPSGLSLDDYHVMLNDLYRIHDQLLFKKNGGFYIGASQLRNVEGINEFLKNIQIPLQQIDVHPDQELSPQLLPILNRSFNLRAEIQKEAGQIVGPSLQLTMAPSVNTYEHQLIHSVLSALEQLNNHILQSEPVQRKRLENDMNEIRKSFTTNYPQYHNASDDKIDSGMQDQITDNKQRKEAKQLEIKKAWLPLLLKYNNQAIEMEIRVPVYLESVQKGLDVDDNERIAGLRKQYHGATYERNVYPNMTIAGRLVNCDSYFYKLENHSLSVVEQKLLYDAFREAKVCDRLGRYSWLSIRARVVQNIMGEDDPIGVLSSNPNYKNYTFSIVNVLAVNVEDGEWQYPSDIDISLDEWIEKNCFESEDEKAKMNQSLVNMIENNQDQHGRLNREEQLVKENAEMIDAYLNLKVIQESATSSSIEILPTPKFLHAALYKNVWQHLIELQAQVKLDLTTLNNMPKFALRPLHNIYEVWCYFKITELLQQMGWELANKAITMQVFKELIEKAKKPTLSQSRVVLHQGDWKVELFYEREFELVAKEHEVERRRPDFTFQIYNNAYLMGTVFLDAKHKNFMEQGELSWRGEIQTVAVDKYGDMHTVEEIGETLVSFLVHSDIQTDIQKRRTGESYYAFYNTKYFENKLAEAGKRGEAHKYGAIGLVPSDTFSFTNWFRMIMEYKLKQYGTCWVCGSHDVKREIYHTRSGQEKFYYTCPNCQEFWVKVHCRTGHLIIKHTRNYHKPWNKINSPWNVYCPTCFDVLDN